VTRKFRELQARLEEAKDLLRAIRSGAIDALLVSGPDGNKVYTLSGAEHPYRVMVEGMNEGAVMMTANGAIFYSNRSFATMLAAPLDQVIGSAWNRFVLAEDLPYCETLFREASIGAAQGEVRLTRADSATVPTYLSISSFEFTEPVGFCVVVTDLTERRNCSSRKLWSERGAWRPRRIGSA
jgi:PAS domain S-box-containing protein